PTVLHTLSLHDALPICCRAVQNGEGNRNASSVFRYVPQGVPGESPAQAEAVIRVLLPTDSSCEGKSIQAFQVAQLCEQSEASDEETWIESTRSISELRELLPSSTACSNSTA